MTNSLKSKALSGVFFRGIELIGMQGIQLLVSIILARLLLPEEFGVIALLTVFIQISNCLVVAGFSSALIQKQKTSIEEESTIFFLNVILSWVMYGLLFYSAPYIADFYNQELLCPVLRWAALTLVINALCQVHSTLLTKAINFKALLKINLLALLISSITGISLAYQGFGVWALVGQQISSALSRTILFWCAGSWRPQLVFQLKCIKELFAFGSKLMISSLLGTVFNNIYVIIIGKIYTPTDLAFYTRSKQLPWVVMNTTSGVIQSVMFPTFSKIKNDTVRLKLCVQKVLKLLYFIISPVLIGLIVCSHPLVEVLLTEKWLPIVPYMQVLIIMYLTLPLQGINLEVFNSLGRSDIYLKLEVIKKILQVIVILITFKFGILIMIWGQVALGFVSIFINTYYAKLLFNYSALEQLRDIAGSLFNAIIMGVICYNLISYLPENNILQVIFLGGIGAPLYLLLSFLTRQESLFQLFEIVQTAIDRKIVKLS